MSEEYATPSLAPAQFGRNLTLSVAGVMTSIVTGFLLAPFLIRHLGYAGYGLIPLINNTAMYMSVANIALNAATVRNIGIAISLNDRQRATEVFSTALWGSIGIGVALVAVGVLASLNATSILNIPLEFAADAQVLFLTATANIVLLLVSSPLSVSIYYSNRLDRKGAIDIATRLLYAALVVLLVMGVARRPSMVGLALVASSVVGVVLVAKWWRKHMPWLRAAPVFRSEIFWDLVTFGGWSVVAHTGNLVFLTIDLIMVNRMIGPVPGGVYAALLQWPALVRGLGTTIAGVFCQPMAHLYARDGEEGLFEYSEQAVRITSALLVVVVVVLCGISRPLLGLWLGIGSIENWSLLWALLFHLGYNMAALPWIAALQTIRHVRALGLLTCVAAILNIGCAFVLVKTTDWGSYAIAIAGAAVLTLLSAVAIPLYAGKVFGKPPSRMLAPIGRALALSVIGSVSGAAAAHRLGIVGWVDTMLFGAALAGLSGAVAAWVLLTREGRDWVLAAIRGTLSGAK